MATLSNDAYWQATPFVTATAGAAAQASYVSALLYPVDWRWNADSPHGTAASITYSFMSQPGGSGYSNFRPMNATEQAAARLAMAEWSKVCNVTFQEVSGGGQIAFGTASLGGSTTGYTTWGGTTGRDSGYKTTHADVYISNSFGLGFEDGSTGLRTVLHEIGHALGLKHTFDSSGPTLSGVENTAQYSIMSYADAPDTPNTEPGTPQLYDIGAIQYLYGAARSATGNDTYQLSAAKCQVKTIWDAGGVDTVSAANQSLACKIDLGAGHFSDIGPYGSGAAHNNLAIAFGTVIENATGGAGNDILVGNDAANLLDGGAGADRMAGGLGGDTYVVGQTGDTVVEYSGQGVDTVRSALGYTLGSFVENLALTGAAAVNATGSSWHNVITGNGAGNVITGMAGNDKLAGGGGADVFRYLSTGDGRDSITDFTTGVDKVSLDHAGFALALGTATAGGNFAQVAAAYTGANGSGGEYGAGRACLVLDSTGTLYYDANGKAAGGHTALATFQAGANVHASDIVIA